VLEKGGVLGCQERGREKAGLGKRKEKEKTFKQKGNKRTRSFENKIISKSNKFYFGCYRQA
jgi:hypothetical protein